MRENKAKKTKIRSKMKGRGAFRLVKNRFFKGGIFVEIQLVLKNKELKVCVDISKHQVNKVEIFYRSGWIMCGSHTSSLMMSIGIKPCRA